MWRASLASPQSSGVLIRVRREGPHRTEKAGSREASSKHNFRSAVLRSTTDINESVFEKSETCIKWSLELFSIPTRQVRNVSRVKRERF